MLDKKKITYFSKQTIGLAQQQVDMGGLPFSSIIVNQNGDCIGEGVNQVYESNDCTAHAEIQAIRAACETLGRTDLTGSTLFASGEPCGLCYMAIRLAKISQVVILLDRDEVKNLGFDYLWTYQSQHGITPRFKVKNLSNEFRFAPFIQCQQGLNTIGL
ncbi:nucleoside deaminase [Marinobacterium rhizophilum]|uniref:Nucleoside deaminase n=1 Tax=Marinobacterium rhizophilum TaxID=420402 RepID=A0ABY5HL06_9GAMM|nr:nucleoside deaminase [Marinobacterium rhizophilum]UTW13081.1 nucleoside deaminase [Marinobacterium rhizophilum]